MGWALKLAPFIGSLMLTLGLVQTFAALTAEPVKMRMVGTGLLIASGGVLLITKRTGGTARLAGWVLGSIAAAAAMLLALR